MMQFTNAPQSQRLSFNSSVTVQAPVAGRPSTVPYSAGFMAGDIYNDVLYVCGGDSGPGAPFNYLYALDLKTNTWTALANMPVGMKNFAVVAYSGKLYVTGGVGYSTSASNMLQIYDISTNSWVQGPLLSYGRYDHMSVLLNGTIYIIGGRSGNGTNLYAVESFDPVLGTWSSKPSVASIYGACYDMPTWVYQGKIFCPSYTNGGSASYLHCYDPASNAWTPKQISSTYGTFGPGSKAFLIDDAVYTMLRSTGSAYFIPFYHAQNYVGGNLNESITPRTVSLGREYALGSFLIQNPKNQWEIFSLGGSPTMNNLDVFTRTYLYNPMNQNGVFLKTRSDSSAFIVRDGNNSLSFKMQAGTEDGPFDNPKIYLNDWVGAKYLFAFATK